MSAGWLVHLCFQRSAYLLHPCWLRLPFSFEHLSFHTHPHSHPQRPPASSQSGDDGRYDESASFEERWYHQRHSAKTPNPSRHTCPRVVSHGGSQLGAGVLFPSGRASISEWAEAFVSTSVWDHFKKAPWRPEEADICLWMLLGPSPLDSPTRDHAWIAQLDYFSEWRSGDQGPQFLGDLIAQRFQEQFLSLAGRGTQSSPLPHRLPFTPSPILPHPSTTYSLHPRLPSASSMREVLSTAAISTEGERAPAHIPFSFRSEDSHGVRFSREPTGTLQSCFASRLPAAHPWIRTMRTA